MHGDGIITWPDGTNNYLLEVESILVVIDTIRNMDMEYLNGVMGGNTEATGSMVNNMASGSILIQMVNHVKEIGLKESESGG